jgi:colanic acid biosynthesis glycosyl transferase WcaI
MKILLLNQYYPPDLAPTGMYLRDLAQALSARGHEVAVLCSSGGYADAGAGAPGDDARVTVCRLPGLRAGARGRLGKAIGYLFFFTRAALRLRGWRPRPDLVLALTTPPFAGWLAAGFSRATGCRHAHWIMDLYPDVLVAHGSMRAGSLPHGVLTRLARAMFHESCLIVTLGPDMLARVLEYLDGSPVARERAISIPLWAGRELRPWPPDQENPARVRYGWQRETIVFMYSGNMGLGHRMKEFLEAARGTAGDADVLWAFAGDGRRRGEVQQFATAHPECNIRMLPYVDEQHLEEHLAAGDVHLVSMEPAWRGAILPSKAQAAFAAGRPVIFVGPADNSAGRWIAESGGGWIVTPGDVKGMMQAVRAARDPAERRARGAAARKYAEEHFGRDGGCSALCDRLEQAAAGAGVTAVAGGAA